VGKTIVACSPHPDDEAIGAGGFLLRHRHGSDLHLICVSDGEKDGCVLKRDNGVSANGRISLAEARHREFADVAKRLNAASVSCLGLPDGAARPTMEQATRLRDLISSKKPDVVLLPWFLDNHPDHRLTNILYAWSCAGLDCAVLAYEVWTMLTPNAILDISDVLPEKLELVSVYKSQTETIDYISFCKGLARTRAFYYPVSCTRSGAVEAFLSLPNHEYCDLVKAVYGDAGKLSPAAHALLT
jgi:LmbE family N-acetylglucosaminyl deacetylase